MPQNALTRVIFASRGGGRFNYITNKVSLCITQCFFIQKVLTKRTHCHISTITPTCRAIHPCQGDSPWAFWKASCRDAERLPMFGRLPTTFVLLRRTSLFFRRPPSWWFGQVHARCDRTQLEVDDPGYLLRSLPIAEYGHRRMLVTCEGSADPVCTPACGVGHRIHH